MDLGIAGRRAAVAAASKGLGFAAASALAAEGVRVAICSRHGAEIADAAGRIGADVVPIVADVGTVAGAEGFVAEAAEALGGIDILVANAGGPPPGNFAAIDDVTAYARAFELNALSAIAMCRATVPAMRERGWGRVVAITSIAARQPIANLILSNTARAGLTGFLKTLAARDRGRRRHGEQPPARPARDRADHGTLRRSDRPRRDRARRSGGGAGRLRCVRGLRVLRGGGVSHGHRDPGRRWSGRGTAVIRHVSVLTFADDATDEQIDAVATALRELPATIPELRDYRVGRDLGIDPGNGSFVVIGDFDDEDGYRAYRDHPDHVAVARAHILPILAGRTAAQYTL